MSWGDDPGLWCEVVRSDLAGRPALFLDRDGVIVEDTGYLGRAADLRVIPGAAAAIAACNRNAIPVVLITNQSGIGRGTYGWDGFRAVQAALARALAEADARLDAVLACAYHPEGREPYRVAGHSWRKPNPGMLLEAAGRLKLDLGRSWVVGDRATDIEAGRAAALAGGVLVATGYGRVERAAALAVADGRYLVEASPTLADAIAMLVGRGLLRGHI
jgi:D-glycero-D-manno-heptose 1,7-bisphosphate phosphatase